jgi:nicotinate-nucleotide pyrophosphorylase (carboxylating)
MVEADSVEQAEAVAYAGADMVLLDNMDDTDIARATQGVRAIAEQRRARIVVEVSGNVAIERLPGLAAIGVDRVSTSALTLARPLDLALDEAMDEAMDDERPADTEETS